MNSATGDQYGFRIVKEDRRISLAILSIYAILAIQYLILFYFKLSESSLGNQIQWLSKGIVGLLFLLSVSTVIKRSGQLLVSMYLLLSILFLYNYLIFPQNSAELTSIISSFFFICIPSFIFSYSIENRKTFMEMTYKISNVVLVTGMITGILVFMKIIDIGKYSMSLSYYMLFPATVNAYALITKKSMISALKCIASMGVILSIGSRGAVMCFGVYVILAFLKNIHKLSRKNAFIFSTIISTSVICFIFMDNILKFAYETFSRMGIRSRTLLLLLQDPLYSSGRDWRYDTIIEQIKNNPLLGIGIGGDRVILGGYSHNIFIEIVSGFGIVIGFLLVIILMYICVKTFFSKNEFDSNVMILWFSIGFVPLLVSSSYLIDFTFWIFLGLAVRILSDRRTNGHTMDALEEK